MVELVDSVDLGSSVFDVQVRVLLPAPENDKFRQKLVVFSYIRLTASYMPAGVRGEYNITETVGFNITFCIAKYITPSKTEYH